jgi:hypothetical protein
LQFFFNLGLVIRDGFLTQVHGFCTIRNTFTKRQQPENFKLTRRQTGDALTFFMELSVVILQQCSLAGVGVSQMKRMNGLDQFFWLRIFGHKAFGTRLQGALHHRQGVIHAADQHTGLWFT